MVLMFGISFDNNQIQAQSDLKELKGYAWSSNIGWISMNCSNDNSCDKSDYKVVLDEDTGNLTGHAWSSNVGWLQFGDLSGFPEGSGTKSINARINPDTNEMEGWARFLSFGDDKLTEVTTTVSNPEVTRTGVTKDTLIYLLRDGSSSMGGWRGILDNVFSQLKPRINDYFNIPEDQNNVFSSGASEYFLAQVCNSFSNNQRLLDNPNSDVYVFYFQNEATGEYYSGEWAIDDSWNNHFRRLFVNNCGPNNNIDNLVDRINFRMINPAGYSGHFQTFLDYTFDPSAPNPYWLGSGSQIDNDLWEHLNVRDIDPNFGSLSTEQKTDAVFDYIVGELGVEIVEETGETSTTIQTIETNHLAWDGWVSLSGNTYGPTRDNNKISGYAWGDDVVGWIAFDNNLDQVTIEEATAQCGPVNGKKVDGKGDIIDNECKIGSSTTVSEANQRSWTWQCIVDDSYGIDELGSPNVSCGASCENDEWICNDQCIPLSQQCDNECPAGYESDETTGSCIPTTTPETGQATISQFQANPRIINPGNACNLDWTIETNNTSLISCTISSDDTNDTDIQLTLTPHAGETIPISDTETFQDVETTTQYTLTCTDITTGNILDDPKTTRCAINPNFIEF